MLKTRKSKKWISVLVTLVFLFSLLPAAAFAANTNYTNFAGVWVPATTGDAVYGGSASAVDSKNTGYNWDEATDIYVKVTLPDGVTYNTKPTSEVGYVTVNAGTINFIDSASNMLEVMVKSAATEKVTFNFNALANSLKVASDVTGDIKVTLEARGWKDGGFVFAETGTVTIAKVQGDEISVTAGTPTNVTNDFGVTVADIIIQEAMPGKLAADEVIVVRATNSNVTFTDVAEVKATRSAGFASADIALTGKGTNKVSFTPGAVSTVMGGKITLKLKVNVPPSVSGDIEVNVYSEATNSKLKSTTLKVATVGEASASIVDLKKNDKIAYTNNTSQALDAEFKIKSNTGSDLQKDKTVILELSAGKFDKATGKVPTVDGKAVTLYNSDKSAWVQLPAAKKEVVVKNFNVIAEGNVEPGDIVVKVSGTAGASGEAVIGKYAAPLTATASKPIVNLPGLAQAAGDIVITEAGTGAIPNNTEIAKGLVVKLPIGVSFNGTPTVSVSGSLSKGTVKLNGDRELQIEVTSKSAGSPSTITIKNIKYDLNKLAIDGDISADIYVNETKVASVANAATVSDTVRDASFVIGSSTYTVGGVEYTMDQASYVKDGRSYLPVRYAAYALGVTPENILFDGGNVTLLKGDKVVQVTLGSNVMKINGISITMDVAPELSAANRTMLPFRWIAQAFGAQVDWDEATQTVTMSLK